jgi:hypothetical protein
VCRPFSIATFLFFCAAFGGAELIEGFLMRETDTFRLVWGGKKGCGKSKRRFKKGPINKILPPTQTNTFSANFYIYSQKIAFTQFWRVEGLERNWCMMENDLVENFDKKIEAARENCFDGILRVCCEFGEIKCRQ